MYTATVIFSERLSYATGRFYASKTRHGNYISIQITLNVTLK